MRCVKGKAGVADVCRQMAVSEATFCIWKRQIRHLVVTELRRLRQLEDENNRLKRLVADLTLDKHMLSGRTNGVGSRSNSVSSVTRFRSAASKGACQRHAIHRGTVRQLTPHSIALLHHHRWKDCPNEKIVACESFR